MESQYERLYTDTRDCLKKLSRIYKIGVIANQSLGTSERLENLGVRKYLDLIIASAEEAFQNQIGAYLKLHWKEAVVSQRMQS